MVTLNNTALEDNSPIPDSAYKEVDLPDLDGSGFIEGKYVSTRNTSDRIKRLALDFIFKRQDKAFKEVMVYYHIDRVRRYYLELGFQEIRQDPIPVDVAGTTDDNSFYRPTDKSLTFGTGGVDDAEDAEIILHEFGHASQDAILPGFGQIQGRPGNGRGIWRLPGRNLLRGAQT